MNRKVNSLLGFLISALISFTLVFAFMPVTASAASGDTGSDQGFNWTELPDGTVEVTGYIGPGSAVDMPGTLNALGTDNVTYGKNATLPTEPSRDG